MKKINYCAISGVLIFVLCFTICFNYVNEKEVLTNCGIVTENQSTVNTDIENIFDKYEITENETHNQITAYKKMTAAEIGMCNIGTEEKLNTVYDVVYNYEAEIIYLSITVTDQNENIVSVQVAEAYPLFGENNNIDALFEIDGKFVYLSEILNDSNENCCFLTLTMSLFIVKLVSAVILTAKVVLTVSAVVAVAGITYKVVEISMSKIKERERTATKERTKRNPKVYYPAIRKDGKLLIAASPIGLTVASKAILTGTDFWSPFDHTAKLLAISASGGSIGPEVDSKKNGYYYHFHLLNRIGGHSFYSTPTGGIY